MNMNWGVLFLVVLTGCNGWVSPETNGSLTDRYFSVFSGPPLPGVMVASAVQWNSDYAVTAAHTPFLRNQAYRCSTGCDLLFITHKAEGQVPRWRDFRPGEAVTALGSSSLLIPMSAQGRIWPASFVKPGSSSQEHYGIHDAAIAKGMSGGPLIASDGSVLGINIGYSKGWSAQPDRPEKAGMARLSVFVPYSVILREWRLFQAQAAKNAAHPLQAKNQ
ncbi:serine protease [Pseudomonas sp. SCB32]|uniref:serine protease n=1 Tax=Pseudomonas sp. SCB32 TaxID=2653853 RepID=UPI001264937D|nr:serine protease [Pseudomonas sp. SCB32]